MSYTIGQIIGFVGTGLVIAAYQCKSAGRLLFMQALGSVAFVIHFFLLGGYTGCVMQVAVTLNGILLCMKHTPWAAWRGWKWCVCLAAVIITLFTWQGPLSILPCLGTFSSTLSNWSRNGKVIRLARIGIAGPLWLIYDACVRSYSGILCESFCIGSALLAFWRYGGKELDQEN